MSNTRSEVVKTAGEGITGVMKDWVTLALTGLGISLAPHEFFGGLVMALAAAMVARHWAPEQDNNEVGLVLLTAGLAAIVTAELLPIAAPHWPAQLAMSAAGFFSRFAVQFLIRLARRVQTRSNELADTLIDRALPPGNKPDKDEDKP